MTPKKPAMQPLARAAMPARKKSTATPFRDATAKPGLQPLARASLLGRKKMVGQTDKEDAKKVALQPLAKAAMLMRKKSKPVKKVETAAPATAPATAPADTATPAMKRGGLAMFKGKETKREKMKEAKPVKAKGLGIMGGMPTKPFGDRAQRNAKSDSAVAKKQPGSQMRAKMEAAKAKTENYVAKAQAKRAAEKTSGGLGSAGPKRTPAQDKSFMDRLRPALDELTKRQSAAPTAMMKKGGMCKTKKYARGGGIEVRGKTKGKLI